MDIKKEEGTQGEEVTKTPVVEETPKEVETPEVEVKKEDTPEEPKIADVLPIKKNEKPENIPFDVFEKMKKDLKGEIRDLKEVNEKPKDSVLKDMDLGELSKKYDVGEEFLADFAKSIESKTLGQFEDRFGKLEKNEKDAQINKAFKTNFESVIEKMPDYKDVVVPEVIKALSLLEENQDKTFSQLIEATYSSSVTGRQTIEKTVPGGGQEPTEVDIKRAQTDAAYFSEVMKNPELKKQYNEGLETRINF